MVDACLGVAGFRTQIISTFFKLYDQIAILYCITALAILSFVYGFDFSVYNQTVLPYCIVGLFAFLLYLITPVCFSQAYKPAPKPTSRAKYPMSATSHTSAPPIRELCHAAQSRPTPIIKAIIDAFTARFTSFSISIKPSRLHYAAVFLKGFVSPIRRIPTPYARAPAKPASLAIGRARLTTQIPHFYAQFAASCRHGEAASGVIALGGQDAGLARAMDMRFKKTYPYTSGLHGLRCPLWR